MWIISIVGAFIFEARQKTQFPKETLLPLVSVIYDISSGYISPQFSSVVKPPLFVRHSRAIKTQKTHLLPTLRPRLHTRRITRTAVITAPCPSLLLVPGSSLLPVNLPAIPCALWQAALQLAALCQGCRHADRQTDRGDPNGHGDVQRQPHSSSARTTDWLTAAARTRKNM